MDRKAPKRSRPESDLHPRASDHGHPADASGLDRSGAEEEARYLALEALSRATGDSLDALLDADVRASEGFVPLARQDPGLDSTLKRRYAEQWLERVRVPDWTVEDALSTVELEIAPGDRTGEFRLRLRSTFTGTTYCLDPWNGSATDALAFVDDMAELQAANVQEERRGWSTDVGDELPD